MGINDLSVHQPERPGGKAQPRRATLRADRDLLTLGIVLAALLLFVATGGSALPRAIAALTGTGQGPNVLLTNALLLNIALIIFSWRRYEELRREVSERENAEDRAQKLAQTDSLTACLNRHSVAPAMEELMVDATDRGEVMAFLVVDLDHFKQINDCNGHAAGDHILRTAATRIRSQVPAGTLVARLGGDEFACAVPFDPLHADRIDALAGRIIEAFATPMEGEGFSGLVTVSIGMSRSDCPNRVGTVQADAAMLMQMADIAMYEAKKGGRGRQLWFEDSMESELRYRSELESGIREGIAKGEFVPFYEQQIDLVTGDLVGFEMLARWQSPSFGLIGPDVFIPIAEEIGVIAELSECLIAQALQDAKSWAPHLTLSVNISPLQLRDPWFAQKILKLLVAANFPPNRLDIEITETCLHHNVAGVHTLVTSLKNQGIGISLDDFGTGYSSLAQLRSLPFDRIKIDRSFVTTMPENSDSATIVATITSLGEGLGLPITAEGIENEEVLARLRELGRFMGQGYLYGRPQPAAETFALLAERRLLAESPAERPIAAETPQAPSRDSAAAGDTPDDHDACRRRA